MSFFGVPVSDTLRKCATPEGTHRFTKGQEKKGELHGDWVWIRICLLRVAKTMVIVLSHQDYYDQAKSSHGRHHEWRKTLVHRARNVFGRIATVNCFVFFLFNTVLRTILQSKTSRLSLRKLFFFFQQFFVRKRTELKTKGNRRKRKQRRRNWGKTSICYTNKTEPCIAWKPKLFFFFFTETLLNAWKKKTPSYSLYKCRQSWRQRCRPNWFLPRSDKKKETLSCYKRAG